MPTYREIKKQIRGLIVALIESGLSDDQNWPFEKRDRGNLKEISFPGSKNISIAMKDKSYAEIYDRLKEQRAYLIKMADGALIQMMYLFRNNNIERHRLAFYPSPYLEQFQNDPEIYLDDEIYADIISKNIVPIPIRFDYDHEEELHIELDHPKSHLTLGQYANCRIPVTAPLIPFHFIEFILRNFYHTAHNKYCNKLSSSGYIVFDNTIGDAEKKVVHVQLPLS